MKYILFAGDRFYPNGGCSDFIGHYRSFEAALTRAKAGIDSIDDILDEPYHRDFDWFNILNTETQKVWTQVSKCQGSGAKRRCWSEWGWYPPGQEYHIELEGEK